MPPDLTRTARGPHCVIVAVTGATGYVGRFVVKRLIEAGRAGARLAAAVFRRRAASGPTVEWIDGDLASP